LLAHHKMLAAIACKQYAIVEKLLPECAADVGFPNAPRLLCNTLALALHCRTFYRTYSVEDPRSVPKDQKLLETILKYLKSLNLQDKGNEALCKELVTDPLAVFQFATAIEYVIGAKANKVLKQLLDFHANHLPRPDRSNFTMWFRAACGRRNEAAASLLIALAPGGKSMIVRNNLQTAFYSSEAIIKATLGQLKVADTNKGTLVTLPLFMAVRSGRVTAVRVFLEAGSDPNVLVKSNITSLKKFHVSPLDVAFYHKNTAVAKYLLSHGVDVPHISEWPTDQANFGALCDWMIEHKGSKIPTWSEARKLRLSGSLKDLKY
jgi:hypothetical protein